MADVTIVLVVFALGLVANQWSVQQCIDQFRDLCGKAFTARTGSNIPFLGVLAQMHNHSKYETQPLEEALQYAYGEDKYLFGGQRTRKLDGFDIKVGVTTASTAGNAILLTNYNRDCREKRK